MTDALWLARLHDLVRDEYVFPDVAEQIVAGLPSMPPGGSSDEVARALTTTLQRVNNDLHLRVRRRAPGSTGETDWDAYYEAQALATAGGIQRVERLDAQTGLLALAPYTAPVHLAERYVAAAFALLAGVERLVIDLRNGRGGVPETIAVICSYLLGAESVRLNDVVERSGEARQFWTSPMAGRLPDSVRIAALTSSVTFSGCEELAYNLQALGRATVYGERTGGGAHPCGAYELTDDLEVTIPVARSVNAVTGTNWEQVGVLPDVDCAAEDALDRALADFEAGESQANRAKAESSATDGVR